MSPATLSRERAVLLATAQRNDVHSADPFPAAWWRGVRPPISLVLGDNPAEISSSILSMAPVPAAVCIGKYPRRLSYVEIHSGGEVRKQGGARGSFQIAGERVCASRTCSEVTIQSVLTSGPE